MLNRFFIQKLWIHFNYSELKVGTFYLFLYRNCPASCARCNKKSRIDCQMTEVFDSFNRSKIICKTHESLNGFLSNLIFISW